jgi:SAM-dependent methyltransferase
VNRIITFIENLRVYKWLKTIRNGEIKKNISPGLLFILQYEEEHLDRYDIIVRLLAIENLQGLNDFGISLYNKMQVSREQYLHEQGIKIKPEDLFAYKKNTLKELIRNFEANGFDKKKPLVVNSNYKLIDGSHRLACALFFNSKSIAIKNTHKTKVPYGLNWFGNFFTEDELEIISKKEDEVFEQIDTKKLLHEILNLEHQNFGRGSFYQSNEELNILGQRPTAKRFEIYQLDNLLKLQHDVLDIGSNCGFISLKAANKVNSVTGIEISETLVLISRITKRKLRIRNAEFILGDFSKIEFDKKFDFIFSFAVHYWVGLSIKRYAEKLKSLLKPNGIVLIESQDIERFDNDWDEKISTILSVGFEVIKDGSIKDDGVISRRFAILKKLF